MNCVHCGYNSDSEICPNCGASMPVVQQNDNYYHDNNQNYNQQQYNNTGAYNNYEQQHPQQHPQQQYNQPYNDQQYNNNQYNNQYNNNQYDNPYAPGYNNGYNNDNGYNNGFNNGNNNNNGNNTNNNNILVAIISVAAVVIIGLVAALVVFSMDKPEKETTTTTTEATTEYEYEEDDDDDNDSYDVDIDVDVDRTEYSSSGVVQPDYSISGIYYVTADIGLVLRKGPGKGYSKILTIDHSHSVSARGASSTISGWYYVYYSGYYGWVSTQYLSTTKPYKVTTNSYSVYDVIWYDTYYTKYVSPYKGLNIRSGASTSCYSLTTLPQGTEVVVKGKSAYNGSWVYVTAYPPCGNVYSGFVSAQYLRY